MDSIKSKDNVTHTSTSPLAEVYHIFGLPDLSKQPMRINTTEKHSIEIPNQ